MVCFLANAGIFIRYGRRSVLIDGLQRGTERFSGMSEDQIRDVISGRDMYARIDCMLVTHDHPDHYDQALARRFQRHHPETVCLGPVVPEGPHSGVLDQPEGFAIMSGIEIHFVRVLHEGSEYRDVVNYAYDIRIDDFEFAVLGDAALAAPNLRHVAGGRTLNALFVNFPFLTLRAGRARLKKELYSDRLFVYHLPFEADDKENYRGSAFWSLSKARELGLPPTTLFAFPDTCVSL